MQPLRMKVTAASSPALTTEGAEDHGASAAALAPDSTVVTCTMRHPAAWRPAADARSPSPRSAAQHHLSCLLVTTLHPNAQRVTLDL